MSPFLPTEAGADLLPAPADLPEQLVEREIDEELVDLLCDDAAWLDETFREIVATSWADPPRGGEVRPAARPRRYGAPGRRASRHDGSRRSQWCPRPHRRQRSPPRST